MARTSNNSKKSPDKLPFSAEKKNFVLSKPSNPKCSPGKMQDQHSEVRMFAVPGGCSGFGLYLKRDGNPPYASWADKLMFDFLRSRPRPDWMDSLNIYDTTYELHRDNTLIANQRGWGVRVYLLFTDEDVTRDIAFQIANCVAGNINDGGGLKEHQTVFVPEDFLDIDASWYDIIGHVGTRKLAHKLLREDPVELGEHFRTNPDVFHSFWKTDQITLEEAQHVRLPASMGDEIGTVG